MRRRKFLAGASAATAAGAAFSILNYPRTARAWGQWPTAGEAADYMLAENRRPEGVLELHVNGGMSCFDSFYTVPDWGVEARTFLHTYRDDPDLDPEDDLDAQFAACSGLADTSRLSREFAEDGNNQLISLGPWCYPFWSRPDVTSRMRIVVTYHTQAAHEGANPLSFSGLLLGNNRMAGLGTAIQHYYAEREGVRSAPYSYVLTRAGYQNFNGAAAASVGMHPGSSKPLIVPVSSNSQLASLLERTSSGGAPRSMSEQQAFDAALAHYRGQYEARLRHSSSMVSARSPERAAFDFASFSRQNAPQLTNILTPEMFEQVPFTELCGEDTLRSYGNGDNVPRMQARLASHLLTRGENERARYVMWLDTGLEPRPTGGHDVHSQSVRYNATNLAGTFEALLDRIVDPNDERDGDESRIDLDRHMVVINTEFGRTHTRQGGGTGTNHNPRGYVQVFIGGPITGSSVYGSMLEETGQSAPNFSVNPAISRMMVLQTMGIYPFERDSYNVADAQRFAGEDIDEIGAVRNIYNTYLGLGA